MTPVGVPDPAEVEAQPSEPSAAEVLGRAIPDAIADSLAEEAEQVAAEWQEWVDTRTQQKRSSMPVHLADVAIILMHRAYLITQVATLTADHDRTRDRELGERIAAAISARYDIYRDEERPDAPNYQEGLLDGLDIAEQIARAESERAQHTGTGGE